MSLHPIPAVSVLPKIEDDDWELPAPLCLLYLCRRLIVSTIRSFTWFSILSGGVPKWTHTNIRFTFPNKGLCVRAFSTGHSSVTTLSKVSVSTSLLLHLSPLHHTHSVSVGFFIATRRLCLLPLVWFTPFLSIIHDKQMMRIKSLNSTSDLLWFDKFCF